MLSWLMFATLLVDPRAGRGEISGGVAVELRGGYAPRQAGVPSEPSMLLLLVPNVDFRYQHRRSGVFSFGYSPRLLYRAPNLLSVSRPLLLNQLSLGYSVRLDRRWNLYASTNASLGEIDYTATNLAFQQPQAVLADAEVLLLAIGDAELRFVGRLAPRHTLTLATNFGYRQSLNSDPSAPNAAGETPNTIPNQLAGYLGVQYGYRATHRDEITLSTYNGVIEFQPGATFLSDDARVGWTRRLAERVSSQIDGGVLSARVLQPDPRPAAPPATNSLQPVGNAGVSGRLRSRASHTVDGAIGATFTGFFDAVRAELSPRAGGSVQLNVNFPPRWGVGLNSSYFTAATASPLPRVITFDGRQVPQTEAALLNQLPIRYRIRDDMHLEFGVIANFRMPHPAAGTLAGTQTELWGYVAFRIAAGTARGRREVATRSVGGGQGAAVGTGGVGRR